MIDNEIMFWVEERRNVGCKAGKEWALHAQIGRSSSWVLKTWEKRPTDAVVEECKTLIMRSSEFYHKHLEIPRFEMREVYRD